jgi:hypothetical protein
MMLRDEWIRAFSGMTGSAVDTDEVNLVLELITIIESVADPVAAGASCLLLERASISIAEGVRLAQSLASWDDSWG